MMIVRATETDYFNVPDGPICRLCGIFISESPHIEGGKAKCLDQNADVCTDCCPDDICTSARDEAAREGDEPNEHLLRLQN